MRLSQRSYPHPVVGNRNDVPNVAFQATIEVNSDKEKIYVDVDINCSSETINTLIARDKAAYTLHVDCSNTVFRKAYNFSIPKIRIPISADNLNDLVEINLFVCATQKIDNYRVDKSNPEYGNIGFKIRPGDILAITDGYSFHIDPSFDSLSRIGSIMQIQESNDDADKMRVDFNGDKITIFLSKRDFADYKLVKSNERVAPSLTAIIVLPTLIEAIHTLVENSERELDARRWVRALMKRMEQLGLNPDSDAIGLIQDLLESPIRRALASSLMLIEE